MVTTRREMCFLLSGLLPVASEMRAVVSASKDNPLPSGSFEFDKLPLHISNNNAQVRNIMRGQLATGEGLEMRETTLPPGGAPTATTHHLSTRSCG